MTLAKITFTNAPKLTTRTQQAATSDSMIIDLVDCYDHDDEREVTRMLHCSGPERIYMMENQDCGGRAEEDGVGDEGKEEDRCRYLKVSVLLRYKTLANNRIFIILS